VSGAFCLCSWYNHRNMAVTTDRSVHKLFRKTHDPIWQLQLGVLVIAVMQYFTNASFLPYDKSIIIGLELVLMFALAIVTSEGYSKVSRSRRSLTMLLIAVIAVINIFSLVFLIRAFLFGHSDAVTGQELLMSGLTIYITNILMFALLYWEMDGDGPDHRVSSVRRRDFVFPQMIHKALATDTWRPGFMDYLYLSTTNVTNFASADTIPVSHRAKFLMMVQAIVSLVIVVLVVARAIGLG
jgi:uncharacterized membrane protein